MRKDVYKSWTLSLSTIVVLSMAGCGGSSSGSDTVNAISTAYSGVVIDGILVDSTVCIDANENATCDEGEPSATTDAQGKFTIAETTVTGSFLVKGGTDIGTGLSFTGALSAPAGSTVITPLTSAVQSLVKSGKSAEEAEANVKAALGVPSNVNLTSFDPFESANDANTTVAEYAQAVMASQAHLQTIVHAASVAVAGADTNQSIAGVMGGVFSQISQSFDGAITDVNLSVADVTAATKTVANELYANNPAALVSVKSNAQATAQSAVDAAEITQASIKEGTPAQAQGNLNIGITLVNTSIAADINSSIAVSTTAAGKLTTKELSLIVDAQAEQEEKEAAIAAAVAAVEAAVVAQAQAEADYTAALAAADLAAQKAAYDALLEARAQELRQAEAERAVRAAAHETAALAAAQEAQLAADEAAKEAAAAQAAAELAAVQAQAKAGAAEAAARIAAAEAAAAQAAAAVDLEAAIIATTNAERNAAVNIMKVQADALVVNIDVYISHVTTLKDSIEFIQSLDSKYLVDTIIGAKLRSANDALTNLATYAGDTNASAQNLYDFAELIAAESYVTDANVTAANTTLQSVISDEASASSQVVIAQKALDDTRTRILEIQKLDAKEQAEAQADKVEKQRIITEINKALASAQDKNVTGFLSDINISLGAAYTDLNATLSIASDYSTVTFDTQTAQKAYDDAVAANTAAQAAETDFKNALSAIEAELVKAEDGNTTEALSQAKLIEAIAAATIVETKLSEIAALRTALAAGLVTAEGLRDAEILRLEGEAAAKAIRIETMRVEVDKTTATVTTMLISAKAVVEQVKDKFASYDGLETQYPDTVTLIADLNVSLQTLLVSYDSLDSNVTLINDANSSMASAVESQDEASATALLDTTRTANANIEAIGVSLDPIFISIETNIADIQAIVDAPVVEPIDPPIVDLPDDSTGVFAFIDGFGAGGFHKDELDITASYTIVSGGVRSTTNFALDGNGSFVEVLSPSEEGTSNYYNLAGGVWTPDDDIIFSSYDVSSDGLTLTDSAAGNQVQIAKVVNLTTIPDSTNIDIVIEVNNIVPGDANVTFSSGAQAYVFKIKAPDYYELWDTPKDDTNTPYSDIVSAINEGVFHVEDVNGSTLVTFEKNDSNVTIDSAGAQVTALTAGTTTGNLVATSSGEIVGNWEVIIIPGTSSQAIILKGTSASSLRILIALNPAVTNAPVMTGFVDYVGTDDFITQDSPAYNQIAFDDIKAAIESASLTTEVESSDEPIVDIPVEEPSNQEMVSYFVGKTVYGISDSEPVSLTFDDGTIFNNVVSGFSGGMDNIDGAFGIVKDPTDKSEPYTIIGTTLVLSPADSKVTITYLKDGTDGSKLFHTVVYSPDGGTIDQEWDQALYSNISDRDAAI